MKSYLVRTIPASLLEPEWADDNIARLTEEAKQLAAKPFEISGGEFNRVSECTISEMVTEMEKNVLVVDHKGFTHPAPKGKTKEYEAYSTAMLFRLVLSGVSVEGELFDFYTSSAADLKTGKSRMIRHSIRMEKPKEFFFMRNPRTLSAWSANEECKVKATLFSGSEPLPQGILAEEVLIVKSVEFENFFGRTLVMSKEGRLSVVDKYRQNVTHFDGQMIILKREDDDLDIPTSGQGRIGCFKLTWLVLEMSMVRARGRYLGKKLPRTIKDIFGVERELRNIRAICTEDCVKGLKWFKSFEDLCGSLKKMGADQLRMCRGSEESLPEKRDFSRQALQELICATDSDLKQLSFNAAERLVRLNTINGQLEALKKSDGYASSVFEVYPDMLANKHVYEEREASWIREFNKRMVSPIIDGSHYEQIAEDPWAFIDIVLFGIDPMKAGVLKRGQCHCSAKHRAQVFGVRHPANLINGRILRNNRTPWLKMFANIKVFILSVDDITLVGYWDGDVDGDECFWSVSQKLITLMSKTIEKLNPLPFVFPHDKAVKGNYPKTREEWAMEMAKLLHNGVKYNLVGKYSNLATKLLTNLNRNGDNGNWINKAAYAHAMSILCLDFVKTGTLPLAIRKIADKLNSEHQLMPYNQKFMKFKQGFDGETLPMSDCVVDRYGQQLLKLVGTDKFSLDTNSLSYNGNMLINGIVKVLKRDEKTELCKTLEKYASFKTQNVNVVTFNEMLRICFAAVCKLSVDASPKEVKDVYDICRKAMIEFARLPANKMISDGMSDSECLRWAANMAWLYYDRMSSKDSDMRGVNNEYRFVMFVLNLFGDVYAENIIRNMAPSNDIEEPAPKLIVSLDSMPDPLTQEWLSAYCAAGDPK